MHGAAMPESPRRGVSEQHEIVGDRRVVVEFWEPGNIVSNEAKALARRLGGHGINQLVVKKGSATARSLMLQL